MRTLGTLELPGDGTVLWSNGSAKALTGAEARYLAKIVRLAA
jgi:hypothetical protein